MSGNQAYSSMLTITGRSLHSPRVRRPRVANWRLHRKLDPYMGHVSREGSLFDLEAQKHRSVSSLFLRRSLHTTCFRITSVTDH